jgi:WD40 repeat protein
MQLDIRLLNTFEGHKSSIYALAEGDEGGFFSAGGDGIIAHWNVHDNEQGLMLARVQNPVFAMYFHPQSRHLLVAENHEGLHLIDLQQKKEVASLALSKKRFFDIQALDERYWLVAGEEGVLFVIESSTFRCVEKIKLSHERLRSIAVHPQQSLIAVGGSEGVLFLLDKNTLQLKQRLVAHASSIFTVRFHPAGTYLLSGGRDARLKIWDVSAGFTLKQEIPAHYYTLNTLSFHHQGGDFLTGSMDKTIKWWDGNSFRLLKVIDHQRYAGHRSSVNALCWMKYKNLILSAGDDRTIKVWKIEAHR